jgi:hypothetical protein
LGGEDRKPSISSQPPLRKGRATPPRSHASLPQGCTLEEVGGYGEKKEEESSTQIPQTVTFTFSDQGAKPRLRYDPNLDCRNRASDLSSPPHVLAHHASHPLQFFAPHPQQHPRRAQPQSQKQSARDDQTTDPPPPDHPARKESPGHQRAYASNDFLQTEQRHQH